MILCFRFDFLDDKAKLFFNDFRLRCLSDVDLLRNPYKDKALFLFDDLKCGVFRLDVVWFPFYWLGFIGLAVALFLGLGWGWFVLPVFMIVLGLFWFPPFYLLLFNLALRKNGSLTRLKKVNTKFFLEVCLWDKLKFMSS